MIAVQEASDAASRRVGEGAVPVPPALERLVDDDLVPVDLDGLNEAAALAGGRAHQSVPAPVAPRRPSNRAGSETSVKRAIA